MLIFNDYARSPNCLKTKILLLELGIPYERRIVDIDVLRGDAFRKKFPSGMAPAIEDDGLCLTESSAIALYLATKHGRFIPEDLARRGRMFQALALESSFLSPTVGGEGLFGELYRPESERNERRIPELRARAQHVGHTLASVLGDKSYFADEYSIADMQLYAATSKSYDAGVFEKPAPNLVAWIQRMNDKPTVQKARQDYLHYSRSPGDGGSSAKEAAE